MQNWIVVFPFRFLCIFCQPQNTIQWLNDLKCFLSEFFKREICKNSEIILDGGELKQCKQIKNKKMVEFKYLGDNSEKKWDEKKEGPVGKSEFPKK